MGSIEGHESVFFFEVFEDHHLGEEVKKKKERI